MTTNDENPDLPWTPKELAEKLVGEDASTIEAALWSVYGEGVRVGEGKLHPMVTVPGVGETPQSIADAAALHAMRPMIREETRERLKLEWPLPTPKTGTRLLAMTNRDDDVTEESLKKRYDHLLANESRLQQSETMLLDAVDDLPIEQTQKDHFAAIVTASRARPAPDFRRLLINTRKQLEVMGAPPNEAGRAAWKEAMRLTDVTRLHEWPTPAEHTLALRHVVDRLIEDITYDVIDVDWESDHVAMLTEARRDPRAYFERLDREKKEKRH